LKVITFKPLCFKRFSAMIWKLGEYANWRAFYARGLCQISDDIIRDALSVMTRTRPWSILMIDLTNIACGIF
jgi:hypothetical protein